jgi:hypothetical protein
VVGSTIGPVSCYMGLKCPLESVVGSTLGPVICYTGLKWVTRCTGINFRASRLLPRPEMGYKSVLGSTLGQAICYTGLK